MQTCFLFPECKESGRNKWTHQERISTRMKIEGDTIQELKKVTVKTGRDREEEGKKWNIVGKGRRKRKWGKIEN